MEKFITATGKTIDLAIESALAMLGMDRDSVSVEVLDNPKSGFLGFGAVPAKVKVTYEAPDEPAAPALSSASRSKPKKPAEEDPAQQRVIAPAVKTPMPAPKPPLPREPAPHAQQSAPRPRAERPAEPRRPRPERPERAERPERPAEPRRESAPRVHPQPAPRPAEPAEPKVYTPAEPGSIEEKMEIFIKGLLEHMDSDAVPHAYKTADEAYMVELTGENLGILIGRRGETLDAIQHLANYAVNRGAAKRVRINVDAENYRLTSATSSTPRCRSIRTSRPTPPARSPTAASWWPTAGSAAPPPRRTPRKPLRRPRKPTRNRPKRRTKNLPQSPRSSRPNPSPSRKPPPPSPPIPNKQQAAAANGSGPFAAPASPGGSCRRSG
jgi:spoIIIJ-associated protein